MKVRNEIKKLKIEFLSFLTGDKKPSNQFEYIMAKNEGETAGRRFELEADGDQVSLTINKSLAKEEADSLNDLVVELNEFWDKMPPPLSNAILEIVKMAGAAKVEKAPIAGLDEIEALIKKHLGKEEKKGPFDSIPDSFLPPNAQATIAKKKVLELKELMENEDEDPNVKLPGKAVSKQIRRDAPDDDEDPDELEGMPTLSGFLDHHNPHRQG